MSATNRAIARALEHHAPRFADGWPRHKLKARIKRRQRTPHGRIRPIETTEQEAER